MKLLFVGIVVYLVSLNYKGLNWRLLLQNTCEILSKPIDEGNDGSSTLLSNFKEEFNSTVLNAFKNESNSNSFSEVKEFNSTVVDDSKTEFNSASSSNTKEEFSSITVNKTTESNFTVSNKNIEEFNSTLQPALNQLPLTVLSVKCGQNQELKECGSACPPTCNVQSPKCEENCIKDVCQCKVSQLYLKSFIF